MFKTENSNSSESSQSLRKNKPKICLDNRFYFKSILSSHSQYTMYKGVDVQRSLWVHIYGKRIENTFKLSSCFPETVRNQVCPKVLWSGEAKSSKISYFFEVQQRYGPSLRTLFSVIKRGPRQKEVLHLLLEILKLLQKMNSLKLVCGQLTPDLIIFDASPSKSELYLLNSFKLKKRNASLKPIKSKYSSRGAHLGRDLNIKDDLESVCYILLDLYLQGTFLQGKSPNQIEQIKLSGQINKFSDKTPQILTEFYFYISSLNLNDEINFFYWKNYLMKIIEPSTLSKPYSFMFGKCEQTNNNQVNQNINNKNVVDSQDILFCQDQLEEQSEQEVYKRKKRFQQQIFQAKLTRKNQKCPTY